MTDDDKTPEVEVLPSPHSLREECPQPSDGMSPSGARQEEVDGLARQTGGSNLAGAASRRESVFPLEPGHAGKPRQELTLREAREVAARQVDDKLRKAAQEVVESMALAADIDDDVIDIESGFTVREAPVPAEWTPRQKRIAKDSRRSNKDAPVYLKAMQDIHKAYVAADAQKGGDAQPLNVTFATQVNVTYQYGAEDYPVKEIKDDE